MNAIKPTILVCLLACMSCSEPAPQKTQEAIDPETKEEAYVLEESVPDSGMLEGVNPEEIITDDWSDEGEVELDTEQ